MIIVCCCPRNLILIGRFLGFFIISSIVDFKEKSKENMEENKTDNNMNKRKSHAGIKVLSAWLVVMLVIILDRFLISETYGIKPVVPQLYVYTLDDTENVQDIFLLNEEFYQNLMIEENTPKTLYITNYRNDVSGVELYIEKEGKLILRESVDLKHNQWMLDLSKYEEGSYQVSLRVFLKEDSKYYVTGGQAFALMTGNSEIKDKEIKQMADIIIDEGLSEEKDNKVIINYPFIWNTNGYSFKTNENLCFKSKENGLMTIKNNSKDAINVNQVFCDTALWKYKVDNLFGDFLEEGFSHINAAKVNDKNIDTATMYISDKETWESYCGKGKLSLPEKTNYIIVTGEFCLPRTQISKGIVLELKGKIDVEDKLIFDTYKEGDIKILTYENQVDLSDKIEFKTPNISLFWEGEDAPIWEKVNNYMNVSAYNGKETDINMAGEGKAKIIKGSINGHEIELDGNTINVVCDYSNYIDAENAYFDLEFSGVGTASVFEEGGDKYIVVTDEFGCKYGYLLKIDTTKYKLPVVYINTGGGEEITSKTQYLNGIFTIDYNGAYELENVTEQTMRVRGRGNSTWKLDKKPYKIKFDKKVSLFGFDEAKEWVLLANHVDRSLIRNTVALEVAKVTDRFLFVPGSYPVDVFVNGKYQGVYTLGEQVEYKRGRIEGEAQKDSKEEDTDYLIEWGGEGKKTSFGDNRFYSNINTIIEIKYPKEEVLTKEQHTFIKDYINKIDVFVQNNMAYEELLDVDSLVDWFLLYEFTYNTDGIFRRSDFFMKKQGGKLYAAAPWDFDYALGNFCMDSNNYNDWICLGNYKTNAYSGRFIKDNWITFLINTPKFKEKVKARWEEIGEEMYSTAMTTIDTMSENVAPSAAENFKVWPDCFGVKLLNESNATWKLESYEEHVQYLRDFVQKRYEWMDKKIKGM